jgi:transaldolase
MKSSPLLIVKSLGQSIWLDYIQRTLLTSGKFQRLIDKDGVCGVTSNPSILEKAIVEHHDYDAAIKTMRDTEANALYEHLAIEDLQQAADLLRPLYEKTHGHDGFVSFEVSPLLAYDTKATVQEASRLWRALNRPNTLIKVPATPEGVIAIQQLIANGINVNATLLFSLQRYQEVAQAYLDGLEIRVAQGKPLSCMASVASFFLSRIDKLVDSKLDALATKSIQQQIKKLRGETAIASARLAYQKYKRFYSGEHWQRLASAGARPQRLLWASTSTKDPAYSNTKYVEALIGADTINTMPLDLLTTYRNHGDPAARLENNIEAARNSLAKLTDFGLDLNAIAEQLEKEGVQKFSSAYNILLENLRQRIS